MVCGNEVNPLGYTARDHCPKCLCSIHVDINPGDRECNCHGVLRPFSITKKKDKYQLVYKCEKCGEEKHNIMADDDNMDEMYRILSNFSKINI